MADGDVVLDDVGDAAIAMDHRSILHVDALTDGDRSHIAADHRAKPETAEFPTVTDPWTMQLCCEEVVTRGAEVIERIA